MIDKILIYSMGLGIIGGLISGLRGSIIGVILGLVIGVLEERRDKEEKRQLREYFINKIAEREGIGWEEAAKKADEMEWGDRSGKIPPPWLDKEEEK